MTELKRLSIAAEALAVVALLVGCGTTASEDTGNSTRADSCSLLCVPTGGGGGNIAPLTTDRSKIGHGGSGGVIPPEAQRAYNGYIDAIHDHRIGAESKNVSCALCTTQSGSGGRVPGGGDR